MSRQPILLNSDNTRRAVANMVRRYRTCASTANQLRGHLHSFMANPFNRFLVAATGCALATGLGAYLYARQEARRYRLERIRVTTIGATPNGKPPVRLRVLHLSDLHFCAEDHEKAEYLKKLTDDDYDIVVITGDIFEDYGGIIHAHSLMSRPPRLGTFAVLGNHDYFDYKWFNKTVGRINRKFRHPATRRDVEPMVQALSGHGITVLRNSAVTLVDDKIHVIGLDYPGTTQENLSRMAAEVPEDFLVLTLLHLPRRLMQLDQAGVHLAFAGHTHGGQVRLPGFGALITDSELARAEASGVVRRGRTLIHVSRGLSADPRTNFRFFCPPAATLLEVEHYPGSNH